ncbi:ribosomal large subunit pseudouridine synthase, RluD subfamily protein, nonfunctional [Candidatus Saccharibacteria bacterium RAAC3_TM7_1]|nr:ribosomal large subunit pseudouridine synthase, RluD subfamily protein, nonfunctional [Candidatus Saccharibacteria bacterium RAAC3_TM7_1]HCZ28535.1 RluA family pseudouridine synthase [Candidatus Saccharibacteria bacterium]
MRLDVYVAEYWPEQSRSTWQKLIKSGAVKVNGEVITLPKHELGEDDYVSVEQPIPPDFSADSLPILYEDDDVIVINKPVGVLTHSKGALNDEFTVAEFVRPKTTYKADTNRPGIIHRLDRATSGVLLCVKNEEAAAYLQRQFSERKVKKMYMAVVSGIPPEPRAVLDLPIGRNPAKPSTFRVDPNGKPAETYYEVLNHDDRHALVKLQPHTGRTHQLRVHMAYVGTPIIGDTVYGFETAERMYLHAAALEITLPGGKRTTFEAPLPPEFSQQVAA